MAFIIITHNVLPQRILPLCLSVKLQGKGFIQAPVHLWKAGRKKLTHPLPDAAILGDIYKINGCFTLFSHFSPITVL